uniref:Uncharacterized protein n=1 Tax=Panagrolaimus superbus TaxID=310955 RepID=A0A914Z8F9_9BILA
MISVADIATIIDNFLVIKIILIDDWKPWFYVRPLWDTIGWACSGYCIYFQSLLHVGIATNRAWTAFTMNNNNFRIKAASKNGKRFILVIPFVALAILAPRFGGHSKYYYDENHELYTVYVEKDVAVPKGHLAKVAK